VSVLPAYQRQGIGKALIRDRLLRLKEMNAQGCCLVGHPDYYMKFGFKNISGLSYMGCHRSFSSLCLSMGIIRRELSLSTKVSKRSDNRKVPSVLYSSPYSHG
jgi:predicted N-acetyltransferase YhbS